MLYGLIGVLALDLAFGQGGANASQAGAMQKVAHEPFGEWLLIGITIGLAGYAVWRLVEAATGRGIDDSTGDRVVALVSGIVYLSFTVLAIRVLTSPNHNAGQKPKAGSTASDALSLPGGQVVLGIAGGVLVCVALFQLYKGLSQKFVEDARTAEMSQADPALVHRPRRHRLLRPRRGVRAGRRAGAEGRDQRRRPRGQGPRRRAPEAGRGVLRPVTCWQRWRPV